MTFSVLETHSRWRALTKNRNAFTAEDAEDAEEKQERNECSTESVLIVDDLLQQVSGPSVRKLHSNLFTSNTLLSLRSSSASSAVKAFFFLVVSLAASAAESPNDFGFAVPIEGLGSDALHRVAIPPAVYEAAAFADLRDLRVFNGAGEVVPYAFRPVELTQQPQSPLTLPIFPLRGPRDAGAEDLDLSFDKYGSHVSVRLRSRDSRPGQPVLLGYLIDTSTVKTPLIRLDFDWGTARVEHFVSARLEAGDDLKNWNTLASDVQLGGLSHAGQRLERKTIELRTQKSKYLRLLWSDPAQAIELNSVQGLPPERSAPATRAWKEVSATPVAGKPGEYQFDLGGRFPLDRLAFGLPQQNTIVPVQIASRARPEDQWLPVTRTVLYRMQQNGRELVSPEIAIGSNAHRYWMLKIEAAAGGIGAGTLTVRAGWTPREIVFITRGAPPFRLAYGNARVRSGSLGVETLVPGWRTDQEPDMAVATTGAPQKLAGEAAIRQRIDMKKWAMWAALLAGVAVLAWMAWRLSRQLKKE
jgi:Protein of unknown function (DUF3999)